MLSVNRNIILSGIILSTSLIFNTGCVLKKYFVSDNQTTVNQDTYPSSIYEESTQQPQRLDVTPIEAECNDEITVEESDCNRGEISPQQLNNKNIRKTSQGVMHTLKSIQGHNIYIGERSNGFTFPNYPGKVIILEMFGKDCPHCIKEIPIIKNIKKRYRGKLEVIAIQSQSRMGKHTARNYINKYRINYPIIEGEDATNLQYFVQSTYGWTGILPYTLVIKDGVTEFSYPGEVSYKELRKDIDSLFR